MKNKQYEEILQIVAVDELLILLKVRAELRLLFAEMQTAGQATGNGVYAAYLGQVSVAGAQVNGEIQAWFQKQEILYGDQAPSWERRSEPE